MKKYDLAITDENIFKTYQENTLDRNKELFAFIDLLLSIDDNYSIALEGAWGSGKTFFIKQLNMILSLSNSFIDNNYNFNKDKVFQLLPPTTKDLLTTHCPLPIYYDAWKNDNDEDPLLSLLYCIVTTLDTENDLKNSHISLANLVKEIAQKFIPIDLDNIVTSEDALAEITKKKNCEETIHHFFDTLLDERGNKLIILVDELDRCKPLFAIKMLERIKHYLVHKDIVFIFSVNIAELQHTISNIYGTNFSSGRYLDRFFDMRFSLPEIDINRYICCHIDRSFMSETTSIITKRLNLQMRELCKYRVLIENLINKSLFSGTLFQYQAPAAFIQCALLPVAYIYKLTDMNSYHQFINGDKPELLIDIFFMRKEVARFCSFTIFVSNEMGNYENVEENRNEIESRLINIYEYFCKAPIPNSYYDIKQFGDYCIEYNHLKIFRESLNKFN